MVRTAAASARRPLARFGRDEAGSMIVLSLFLLILMLAVGGMGVDFVRYERTRANLQSTADRAVLAAASLNQTLDPETVVRDYFAAAGLDDYLQTVSVTNAYNSRTVTAVASGDMDTYFLKLLGIEALTAPAASTASEAAMDLEIVLVLDVSGSMASDNKLVNLQIAANEFVETIIEEYEPGRVSIGIVPFNGQVNLGAPLASLHNVVDPTGVPGVNCVDLPQAAYDAQVIPPTLAIPATAYADTFSTSFSNYPGNYYASPSSYPPRTTNMWCPPSFTNTVLSPTTSVATLQSHISNLTAVGATSINAGMRWGTTLIDPAFQPRMAGLIALGQSPAALAGHPFAFDTPNARKVIVVMTDGEHFAEERVNAPFRSGPSPVYRASDGTYSVFVAARPGPNRYYVPHANSWQATPWGTAPVQQTWPQLWAEMRMSYVAWQFFARPAGAMGQSMSAAYNAQMDAFRTRTSVASMNAQLQEVCAEAREEGVIVYGIAFQAPQNGRTQIAGCAGTAGRYFDANGMEIQTVFRAIANQIRALRLTQ
ncbi:vWA domain-containing protein [Wenxinia marina]|nr:vWA domain-containing protein [Wenxinia marina]